MEKLDNCRNSRNIIKIGNGKWKTEDGKLKAENEKRKRKQKTEHMALRLLTKTGALSDQALTLEFSGGGRNAFKSQHVRLLARIVISQPGRIYLPAKTEMPASQDVHDF